MSSTNLTGNAIELICMNIQQKVSAKDRKTDKWLEDERSGKATVLHKVQGKLPPEQVFSETSSEKYIMGEDGRRRTLDGNVIGKTSLSKEDFAEKHKRDTKFRSVISQRTNNQEEQTTDR